MNNLVKKFCIILIIISIIFPVFASTAVLAVEDISNADEKVNQEKSEISDSISNNDIPNENASDSDSLPKDDSEIDVEPPDSQDSDVDNESNNSETVDNTNNDIIDDENIGTDDVVVDLDEFPEEIITMDEPIQSQLRTATSNQKLADGTYVIKSALNSNMALTVANGETHNGANIELWDSYNFMYQKFNVRYVNGFYEIISVHSNKSLDVANAGMVNGTNVQLCEFTNHNAQKWILQDAGNGYFYIISKCNNLYVDVFYALARNGTNIQMCEGSQNNRAQMFKFEVVQPIEAKQQSIADGTYTIHSALNENFVLEVANNSLQNGGNIQLFANSSYINQKFNLRYLNNGYYEFTSYTSKKSFDVANSGVTNGTNVQQHTANNSDFQQWILQDAGNGYFYIISKYNELCLDVANGIARNGTNIQLCQKTNHRAQMFKFEKVKPIEAKQQSIADGIYTIHSALNENFVLEVDNGSPYNRGNIRISQNSSYIHQKFNLKYLGNGYYQITSYQYGKSFDVANSGVTNGTNVQQYGVNNSDFQRWIIKDVGNGYYNIISKYNELYLDVADGLPKNESNIQLCQGTPNNKAQMFKFISAGTKRGIDVSQWQGNIDWGAVKASGQVDFAIIRAGYRGWGTEGTLQVDPYFVKNVREAAANNIDIGLYFFTQATNVPEAIEEANFVLNLVRQYNVNLTYPIFIDTEDSGAVNSGKVGRADNLDVWTRTQVCKAFVDTIESYGYRSGIYASRNWFYEKLNTPELITGDIWLAHYTYDVNKKSDFKYRYQLWQYTSSGYIPGINGNVDLNVAYY